MQCSVQVVLHGRQDIWPFQPRVIQQSGPDHIIDGVVDLLHHSIAFRVVRQSQVHLTAQLVLQLLPHVSSKLLALITEESCGIPKYAMTSAIRRRATVRAVWSVVAARTTYLEKKSV